MDRIKIHIKDSEDGDYLFLILTDMDNPLKKVIFKKRKDGSKITIIESSVLPDELKQLKKIANLIFKGPHYSNWEVANEK